jgi:hypothetical protein
MGGCGAHVCAHADEQVAVAKAHLTEHDVAYHAMELLMSLTLGSGPRPGFGAEDAAALSMYRKSDCTGLDVMLVRCFCLCTASAQPVVLTIKSRCCFVSR